MQKHPAEKFHIFVLPVFLMVALILTAAPARTATANESVQIGSIPALYAPENHPSSRELVSMSGYHFEVNIETCRARVVVEYTYPDQISYGPYDDFRGPSPTFSQVKGLAYDPESREVVYSVDGERIVCAKVELGHGLLGDHIHVKNTGACVVTSAAATHVRDDGWAQHRDKTLDTFLEVRQNTSEQKAGL
jgi:hypothetical protein